MSNEVIQTLRQLDTHEHSRDSAGLRYVYPVVSRRAGGVSVGINLNPNNACNWRCIYCQVPGLKRGSAPAIDMALLGKELRGFVHDLLHGDFLRLRVPQAARKIADVAISGNGEPTSAAEFAEVVELVAQVLEEAGLAQTVRARLITNGSLMSRRYVQRGVEVLGRIGGEVWFKVDAGDKAGFARINDVTLEPDQVVRNLRRCAELCTTWVQTCVFTLDGRGPSKEQVADYLELLKRIGTDRLQGVLLYGLARASQQSEAARLGPLPAPVMEKIAAEIENIGLTVQVSP